MHNLILPICKVRNYDIYAFVFDSHVTAQYWMHQFWVKYVKEVRIVDKFRYKIELKDDIFYFITEQDIVTRFKGVHFTNVFPGESVCIILDDPERRRLDTYEED